MTIRQHDLGLSTDLDVIDRYLNINGSFLVDAGCGGMGLSRSLAQRGASVLAIDPDPVQADKNKQADVIPNVGFAEAGAEAIPVETGSVDGVLFPYSLHHVPAELYPRVFTELYRVLKPDGFIYVIEPVADGKLNEVLRMFHDEEAVREAAQQALEEYAIPRFSDVDIINYRIPVQYGSWEEYASRYAAKSYNTRYTEEQVRDDAVKQRFIALGESSGYSFESPMKVTYLQNRKIDAFQ